MVKAGYVIYHPNKPSNKFYFDKSSGGNTHTTTSVNHEEARLELKTFGRVPYVYYAGNMDYQVFDLHTVFIPIYDDEERKVVKKSKDIFNDFKALVRKRDPLIVENSMGEKIYCDVEITQQTNPTLYTEGDMDYIEVSVKCTEIDY